jgi:hypothetical protein
MAKIGRLAAAVGFCAVLAGGAFAPSAMATTTSGHEFACSNSGSGINHVVNCVGKITDNNVLKDVTVTVGDINVLNNTQLSDLEVALANVSDNDVNLPVTIQKVDLTAATVTSYLKDGIILDTSKVLVDVL